MNISGIGTDAVEIERFKKVVEKRGKDFLKKIFTKRELEYTGSKKAVYMHMAGRFAAKEAIKKALPVNIQTGLNWSDIEILNGENGKPYALLHGKAKELMAKYKLSQVFVSISHTETIATSNALVVENGS